MLRMSFNEPTIIRIGSWLSEWFYRCYFNNAQFLWDSFYVLLFRVAAKVMVIVRRKKTFIRSKAIFYFCCSYLSNRHQQLLPKRIIYECSWDLKNFHSGRCHKSVHRSSFQFLVRFLSTSHDSAPFPGLSSAFLSFLWFKFFYSFQLESIPMERSSNTFSQ